VIEVDIAVQPGQPQARFSTARRVRASAQPRLGAPNASPPLPCRPKTRTARHRRYQRRNAVRTLTRTWREARHARRDCQRNFVTPQLHQKRVLRSHTSATRPARWALARRKPCICCALSARRRGLRREHIASGISESPRDRSSEKSGHVRARGAIFKSRRHDAKICCKFNNQRGLFC